MHSAFEAIHSCTKQFIELLTSLHWCPQNDKRYTALSSISEQREQMLLAYIDQISEKNQPRKWSPPGLPACKLYHVASLVIVVL